ncbi:MAG TPA: FAD-dependent oxidoreductase, partial [Polyangiales bacterium]|nr:FAD-dependent oxidoreductase [Polyangiales bacterium]
MATFPDPYTDRASQMFPKLDEAQIERLSRCSKRRRVEAGELLIEAGAAVTPFFVVLSGSIEIVQPTFQGEERVALHVAGEFTGEVNMLARRHGLFRARMFEAGELLELDQDGLRHLVQTDSELSELLMRAFILRRVAMIAHDQGDAVVLGSRHSADTLRIREFLTRNGQPYAYVDVETDPGVQPLLDRFHVQASEVPLVICRGEVLLKSPSNRELAECLGMNHELDEASVHDVIIVGAGPAGLAAAVYAASEGLDVLVLETNAPGGQAGSSSKIENYLGFPTGISGQALAGRAYTQAQKFGAELSIARCALQLDCDRTPYAIKLGDGAQVLGRAIIIAAGAQYRKPALANLAQFEGAGVYYGATRMEAQLCAANEVVVIGGGNSAGQAAVFLSQTAKHVHMLVRSSGLAETMSRYLIRRIEETPNVQVLVQTEIIGLDGKDELEQVTWEHKPTGERATR